VRRQRVAPRHRAERRHSPLAGAVGLRARELARRPEVVAAFSLQAMALVAAVVGSEFGWATERALLARDPRRLRFAGYQLAVAAVLALAWWAVQSLLTVTVAALLQAGGGIVAGATWNAAAHQAALAAALAATLVYGLLGAACALVLRGALAGVVALLAYGLLGELVLAPQWAPATGWTVSTSAARLAGQGTTPVARAALVVTLAFVLALAGCLTLYARRQVRD
jgi:hypothetical protein